MFTNPSGKLTLPVWPTSPWTVSASLASASDSENDWSAVPSVFRPAYWRVTASAPLDVEHVALDSNPS